jgi:hypothetical protein
MQIATWNLNNRVGKVTFRPEAANAAIAINADVIVFTEYYPQTHHLQFCDTLGNAGWEHQLLSADTGEKANRVFIAARCPLQPLALGLPHFDRQFTSNLLGAHIPSLGASIVGVRVPWYETGDLVHSAWDWLETEAAMSVSKPSIILGDLNVELKSARSRGGEHFRRMLADGWHRAAPSTGASYHGHGKNQTEIDHILGTNLCKFSETNYVTQVGDLQLAGGANAISDHAALVSCVNVLPA